MVPRWVHSSRSGEVHRWAVPRWVHSSRSGEVHRWAAPRWAAPSPTAPADQLLPLLALLPHLGVPVHGRGGVGTLLVVHHLVLVPGQPAVGAACQHAVGLGMAGDVAGVQRTGEAVVVDEGVAGVDPIHVVTAVGPHRHRPVLPVQQVGRAGVAPAVRARAAVGEHRRYW